MQRVHPTQLSFDASPKRERRDGEAPLTATIGVTGTFDLLGTLDAEGNVPQLDHGEHVQVHIVDSDGQIIAQGAGKVQVGFKDKVVEEIDVTIREQKIKIVS